MTDSAGPRVRLALGVAALLFVACGACGTGAVRASTSTAPSGAPPPGATTAVPPSLRIEDLAAQFGYDAGASLGARETSSARAGNVTVSEVDYDNGHGATARATLFVPDGTARRPGVVMLAGSNQPRSQLSSEGLGLAGDLSAVVLVVDQSQLAMHRDRVWTFTAQDREEAIETVIDVRRGIDLLVARTDVDPTRIALHGFSYGAWLTAIAAAVDRRASAIVLRSGGPQILPDIAGAVRAADQGFARYLELMATVDQSRYAAAIPAAIPVLVQNGTADTTYSADQMRVWQASVAGDKTAKMYDGAGHTLSAAADAERVAFLRARLRTP